MLKLDMYELKRLTVHHYIRPVTKPSVLEAHRRLFPRDRCAKLMLRKEGDRCLHRHSHVSGFVHNLLGSWHNVMCINKALNDSGGGDNKAEVH